MKTNKLLRHAACAFALTACAAMPAIAKDSGFYLGAGFGQGMYDVNDADFKYFPTTTKLDVDDKDKALILAFGYRILPYVGIELGLNRLGEINTKEIGFFSATVGGMAETKFRTTGGSLAAIGTLPLGRFELYGKVGGIYAETRATVQTINLFGTLPAPGPVLTRGKSKGVEMLYAAGAGFSATEALFLKLEWMRVSKVGDKADYGLAIAVDEPNIDVITAGFQVRF